MYIYDMLWFFMIYSVLGWVIEVAFHAVTLGKVVNRGFLNGPICPVYGTGVILVLEVLQFDGYFFGLQSDVARAGSFHLFMIGIIFATLIELIAGFLLDKLFHARWWDYSDRPLNLHGYICLEFSIIWGLAIAFILRVVHPTFVWLVDRVPRRMGWVVMAAAYIILAADLIITTLSILKLNQQLEKMKELESAILRLSDGMSEAIGSTTIKTVLKLDAGYEKVSSNISETRAAAREELEARQEHIRRKIMYSQLFGTGRLVNIFIDKGHRLYQDVIARMKETER